ncbi:3-isopropylmalate dehydrogenase [Hyaloraphidium curvatum]|nr:3-isopropylmalate dehydrogenase [Hyaloraphidium curvatum]
MTESYSIVVLAGDFIGPEVTAQSVKLLRALQPRLAARGTKLDVAELPTGGDAIDKHGASLPDFVWEACARSDAILFGSIGGTRHDTVPGGPRNDSLLHLRKRLDLYCNVRPCKLASKALARSSPVKPELLEGVNIVTLRENCAGTYFGKKIESNGLPGSPPTAMDETVYRVEEVERIARSAANLAKDMSSSLSSPVGPQVECKVTSIDKANVMATSRLWRRTVTRVLSPDPASTDGWRPPVPAPVHFLADAATFLLVSSPRTFNGVCVTDNLFGDLISDESAALCGGSLGVMPSGSLCGWPVEEREIALPSGTSVKKKMPGLYEPVHGSAPDIAGKGIANPVGSILSLAMMFRFSLPFPEIAGLIELAVKKVLDDEEDGGLAMRTPDLKGAGGRTVRTDEFGDAVVKVFSELWDAKNARM